MVKLISFVDTVIGGLFTIVVYSGSYVLAQISTEGLTEQIIGPAGALVLALVVMYYLYKYAKSQREKYEEAQNKLMEEKEKQMQEKREQMNELLKQNDKLIDLAQKPFKNNDNEDY